MTMEFNKASNDRSPKSSQGVSSIYLKQYPLCFQRFFRDLENDCANDLIVYLEYDPVDEANREKVFYQLMSCVVRKYLDQGKLKDEQEYTSKYPNFRDVIKKCFSSQLKISSKTEVEEFLTSGGMGDIYKGRYYLYEGSRVWNPCIIKIARHQDIENYQHQQFTTYGHSLDFEQAQKDLSDRFFREVNITNKIGQPWGVQAYEAGWVSGRARNGVFLCLEFIDGLNFKQFHEKLQEQSGASLSVGAICELIAQVAEAMQRFHNFIIHRDIKPQNLMVVLRGGDGHRFARVIDFGIAKYVEADSSVFHNISESFNLNDIENAKRENCFRGTPDYAPPEQFFDSVGVSCLVDLYALGCTMFELLDVSNAPPFYAQGYPSGAGMRDLTAVQKLHEQGLPEVKFRHKDNPKVRQVLKKMTNPNLMLRYQNAAKLLEELAPLRNHEQLAQAVKAVAENGEYKNPDAKRSWSIKSLLGR